MSRLVAVLAVVIVLLVSACSADVTDSDEYRALEAELATATEAQELAAAEAEQARKDLDQARDEADEARDEADEARDEADAAAAEAEEARAKIAEADARVSEAETALAEAPYVEWPESLRAPIIADCAEAGATGDQSADTAFCSCFVDHLENSIPLVDFLILSLDVFDSELNQFGLPTNMDPEIAAAVGSAALSCSADLTTTKTKPINDIATGDCFDDPLGAVEDAAVVTVHACSEPHDNEVFATLEMPGNDWPGDKAVNRWADTHCMEEFAPYVGTRYESSFLEIGWYYPLEESWVKYDDRNIACILYDPSLEKLSGSMRGPTT
jgi:hypothetical protein